MVLKYLYIYNHSTGSLAICNTHVALLLLLTEMHNCRGDGMELEDVLAEVTDDLADLYIPAEIETVDKPDDAISIFSFYRKFIGRNVPVKIRG